MLKNKIIAGFVLIGLMFSVNNGSFANSKPKSKQSKIFVNPLIPKFKDVPRFFYDLNKFYNIDWEGKNREFFYGNPTVITTNNYLSCKVNYPFAAIKILDCQGYMTDYGNKNILRKINIDFDVSTVNQKILNDGVPSSLDSTELRIPRTLFNFTSLNTSLGSMNSFNANFAGVSSTEPFITKNTNRKFLLEHTVFPIGSVVVYQKQPKPEDYIKKNKDLMSDWLINNSDLICVVPDENRFGCRDKAFIGFYFDDKGFHKFDHSGWFYDNRAKLKWNY